MSTEAITLLIAFWGAMSGTIALMWDVIKWREDAPKLKVTASPNMQMADAVSLSPQQFITVKVVNVGRQQTKITHLAGWVYKSRFHKLIGRHQEAFFVPAHEFARLPSMLAPGDEWIGFIAQESAIALLKDGNLYCGVFDTLGKKPALAPHIKKSQFKIECEV